MNAFDPRLSSEEYNLITSGSAETAVKILRKLLTNPSSLTMDTDRETILLCSKIDAEKELLERFINYIKEKE